MKDSAQLVIIGAGIAGCSTAYHLAKLGWSDIVVLDAGALPRTGGSTSHAPGGVFSTLPSRTLSSFATTTIELLRSLEWEGQSCFHPVGGLELAYTAERWHDLHRKRGLARSFGIDGELVTPARAKELSPLLDQTKVLGAFYTPNDGIARPVEACAAMAEQAERQGVIFIGDTEVSGIEVRNRRVAAVESSRGRIRCEMVLCAVGIWGPLIGRMAGVPIPIQPMQHIYAKTEPLPELKGEPDEVVHPLVRHQDSSLYIRQHGERYGIGTYRHEPLPVEPEAIAKHKDAKGMPSVLPFTRQHFAPVERALKELYPAVARAGIAEAFNGMFSFTPDGFPLLGESTEVKGFWVGEAVWIAHAGGVGHALANWIATGDPEIDLHECDINRLHRHQLTRPYLRRRALQQYREFYDVVHPLAPIEEPRGLRRTPFHGRLETMGAVFLESAGWERPQWLESNAGLLDRRNLPTRDGWAARHWSPIEGAEHRHVREQVALFDLTPFAKIEVTGPGALGLLQRLGSNDVDRPVGQVTYSLMLNRHAGILSDLTVTRLGPDRFLVVAGGAGGMRDLAWIRAHADGHDASVVDVSAQYCTLGLWGPKAPAVLETATRDDISNKALPSYRASDITIGYVPALALRVSYVGEGGFEIYAPTECGPELWDRLWQAGEAHQIIAAGNGALDSLRLERGRRLWGADIDPDTNPYEAGLGRVVRLAKDDFIGREAAERIKTEGPARTLCCMTLDEPDAVLMGKEPISADGQVLGYVTSTNYGYTVGKQIAYGYLPAARARPGEKIEIEYFGRRRPATIAREPLLDADGRRPRP